MGILLRNRLSYSESFLGFIHVLLMCCPWSAAHTEKQTKWLHGIAEPKKKYVSFLLTSEGTNFEQNEYPIGLNLRHPTALFHIGVSSSHNRPGPQLSYRLEFESS